jgi:hypothetical protein
VNAVFIVGKWATVPLSMTEVKGLEVTALAEKHASASRLVKIEAVHNPTS